VLAHQLFAGRPTFAEILAKLDDIFVEMVLQEEVAQKLWQSLKDKVRPPPQ
jgi:hypothetical protein